ncbi:RICIN domain-containing protein [Dactylosporangium aurantiacum]|uniref:RICIN domain-containing protein n=1 Tax=Dactylosporangium aurantiacum TaxID=35754 RepID=A0A9Q9MIZ9_9ACTN|nr:ricin-type beta-trefoil lectin domain protein [Dactylosporangium aurantiacum]MDG6109135.1 ricin-type beta-trefoil lectin domain protein [Dactylosporangium aurantiacum]UWZ58464.1 RICIN domain-containing protein [Dactylosporangium aurantiacum]
MQTFLRRVVLPAVGLMALFVLVPVSPAAAIEPKQIVNNHSYRCLGVANGLAGIWLCATSSKDQAWHRDECHPVYYTYCLVKNDRDECLAVVGGNTTNGSRVLGFPCTKSEDQYWAPYYGTLNWRDNLTNLRASRANGWQPYVLAVDSIRTDNGAPVVIWRWNGSADQSWSWLF